MAQELFANNALTTLASGITNVQTSITVADGSAMPSPTGGDYFRLVLTQAATETLWEVVKVTARSGNTLTVTRGQDGTTARAWSSGDKAECRLSAGSLGDMAQKAGADFSGSVSVVDGSFSIKGSSDATKITKFEVDGFTTGTTRTFTLPNADVTVAGSSAALTSGRIPAATTWGLLTDTFLASTVSGNTATFAGTMGAARVFTLPDASITIAGSASALTSGRVPYATTGGLLTDTANYLFDGSKLTLAAASGTTLAVSSTQASTSTATGCATFAGGIGVAGDIWSASHIMTGNAGVAGHARITSAAGEYGLISWLSATSVRWRLGKTNAAESGANAGSLFELYRYDDSGSLLGTVFSVNRATGTVTWGSGSALVVNNTTASTSTTTGCATFAGGIGVAGAGRFGAGVVSETAIIFRASSVTRATIYTGANTVFESFDGAATFIDNPLVWSNASGGTITLGGSTARPVTFTGNTQANGTAFTFGANTSAGTLVRVNGTTATQRGYEIATAGSLRWQIIANSTAEGGSDAGSPLLVAAFSDSAAFIDSPISIVRASAGTITLGGSTSRTLATTGGRIEKVSTITGNTTLDGTYHNVLCNSASAFTVTLPAASTNSGRVYTIKNINTGTVTIDANASETIDGSLTVALAQYQSIRILCNGSNWFIL